MDFFDVQMYLIIKILLLVFIGASIFLLHKRLHPAYFLVLVGVISSASYYFLVNNLALTFWGLQGDELTIAAMYNTFAHVSLFSDFNYHLLPPFYPPAFFWIFGLVGRAMDWNGVMISKFASTISLLVFPIGLYYSQKYFTKGLSEEPKVLGKVFTLLSPLLLIAVLDKDLFFGKPYEVITGAIAIFWYASMAIRISTGKWSNKLTIVYGVIAGLIFMTYYLWLIFATMALFFMGIFEEKGKRVAYFMSLVKTAGVAILVSTPFLVPLTVSYARHGMENWQTAYFTPDGLNLWMPMFQLTSINCLVLLFGLAVLIYYRNETFIKQLLYLFVMAFLWWGLAMAHLLILKTPFQEFRGFYLLAPGILAISAGYGIERLWHHFKLGEYERRNIAFTLAVIGILYFASQSIFGFFIDDPHIKAQRAISREAGQQMKELVAYLESAPGSSSRLTLHTVPQVLAFVPLDGLIYFNEHNNHPASIFTERMTYVQSLADSKTSDELYNKVKNCPYGKLDQFIFYGDRENYYLIFHVNKIIDGIEEITVPISKKLFTPDHFTKTYDKDGYSVLILKE
ncbi:MAG: arabinofuranosyltransferase [Patescibacteria group bacterium]|jgi:galactan 5-O-arabinofuranosyltransferase